jgi:hypothetical protein
MRRRYLHPNLARRIALERLFDSRSPEQRKCALAVYRVDLALWQEWREQAKRAENIRKLRGIFKHAA